MSVSVDACACARGGGPFQKKEKTTTFLKIRPRPPQASWRHCCCRCPSACRATPAPPHAQTSASQAGGSEARRVCPFA
jgi:hypothetical protein